MKQSDFIKKRINDVISFRKSLTQETDRGCALFAAAYIDNSLSDLLFCALAESKGVDEDLFKGNAPLASFSSRITMAFYLGKISKVERRDLDLIRKIRNEFAHDPNEIDFNTDSIKNRCIELSFSYHDKAYSPRGHFTASCLGILSNIHNETLLCQAPDIKGDNAPSEEQKCAARKFIKD